MARNNDLVVTAGLNIEASVDQIGKDLKQVSDKLTADHALKIIANIDLSKTTQRIQSQLATISKNIKLDVGGINFNNETVVQTVTAVQNSINNLTSGIKANIQIDSSPIKEFGEALGNLDIDDRAITKLQKELEALEITVTKIIPQFKQLKGQDTQKLTSLTIQGIDKFGSSVNLSGAVKDGDIESLTTKVTHNLAEIEKANKKIEDSAKAAQLAYNDFLKVKGQADVYSKQYANEESLKTQLADIQKLIGEFDNTQPLEKQRESIILIDNELKKLKIDIENIKKSSESIVSRGASDFYPNIAKGASSQETMANAKDTLNALFAKTAGMEEDSANRIKRAVEDTTGALKTFYVQVERGDKSVETLTYAINAQGDAYEYLGKTIREADNSTDFRRKGLDVQKQIQTENLDKFIAQVEKSGVATDDLKERIEKLKEMLGDINDTSSMNAFLDDLDIAKAKFQALNAVSRKDNFAETLGNKVKKLAADMNAYAVANKRAVTSTKQMSDGTSFMAKWNDLMSRMAKGADLTADELKHLNEEFRIFGKEAEAVGLKGESAWGKFLSSFKTMSSYITANMVFNMAKRQLRSMANEVIEVDTAMTELRKVTQATDAEFEKFAQSAGKTGRELGASISDVINATSTFSRAGFGLADAEELGKIATLYKNVGDGITIDTASESIISIMKAFNIEAKDSISIIDKINEVSNRAAIDSGGLGLALQRVASAMDAANNSLDETIALTTVSNEIVQNPEMVA